MAANAKRERWAAIDVGSDTIHLLVGDVGRAGRHAGQVRHLDRRSRLVELGRIVATSGRIGPEADEIARHVAKYAAVAERAGARTLVAATEAVRDAPDGPELVDRLATELGLPVHMLSPRREAQLGLLAVRPWLEPRGPQVVIDSGGASTEVTLTLGREALASTSLPIGAARLAAALPGDPPSALEWALEAVGLGRALAVLPQARPAFAWATGGSAHNLIGLEEDRKGPSLPARLSLADLGRLSDVLLRTSARKLARRSGEDPRRVALLAPGALILAALLRHLALEWCTVLPAGLRDGMILAAAEAGESWWMDEPDEPPAAGEEAAAIAGDAADGTGRQSGAPPKPQASSGSPSPDGTSRPV